MPKKVTLQPTVRDHSHAPRHEGIPDLMIDEKTWVQDGASEQPAAREQPGDKEVRPKRSAMKAVPRKGRPEVLGND